MRRLLLPWLIAGVATVLAPPSARAAVGECVVGEPGPVCQIWKGTVRDVGDGDTFDVDLDRDGTRRTRRIRFIGVQAMELSVYDASRRAGDCHAVEATEYTESRVRAGRWRVRLAAQLASSMAGKRYRRLVAVRAGGRWRDLGSELIERGLALWSPHETEWAVNRRYGDLSRAAQAAGRGLFDQNGCGVGPSPGAALQLRVQWDADGDDASNPSGEWVRVRNLDPAGPVPLDGWYLRDTGLRRFVFPPGAVVPPGGAVKLNVGSEGDGLTAFGWGLRAPIFANATRDERAVGDGAYLFDPLGNVRAATMYPCREQCPHPLAGALDLTVEPRGRREQAIVTNRSAGPADLDGLLLKSRPLSYEIPPGTVLAPGESLRVRVVGTPEDDEPLRRTWGLAAPILRDAGDVVSLDTFGDLTLACAAWGDRTC